MPPALSEEDLSSDEQIPATKKRRPAKTVEAEEAEETEEEAEEESEEDEYVVERIVGHRLFKGAIEYDVKWQGYDKLEDRTWEPEDNLDGARDVLQEYWEEIGGRPEAKTKKRKGRKSATQSDSGAPVSKAKRARKEKEWSPPLGSWEHDVDYVDTVEENMDPKTGAPQRYAYLVWNNRKKTQHPLAHVYQKCPQKMLTYYESHLVFTPNDEAGLNGDNNIMKDNEDF